MIYNGEAGVVRMDQDSSPTEELQRLLAGLEYGFDLADVPEKSRVRFLQIVRTSKFANGGETWEGEVVKVSRPDSPLAFSNKEELRRILEG